MKTTLHWKKKLFSKTYRIYAESKQVGSLTENQWKQTAQGELFGEKVGFRTRGTFRHHTEIIDPASKDWFSW